MVSPVQVRPSPFSRLVGSPRWSSRSSRPSSRRGSSAAGEASSVELVAAVPRTDRADRSVAERVRDRLRRGGASPAATRADSTPGDAPFRGVPIAVKDLAATAGIRTTYSSRAYADYVPDFDTAVVRRIRDAGFVIVGKDEHARVRDRRVHGVRAQRVDSQPLEHRSHARRIERRRGGGRLRRPRADRARHRRRRLDPDPRVVLRPLRAEAVARTCLERPVRLVRGPLDRRADGAHRRGRSALPRRRSQATSPAIRGGLLRPSDRSRVTTAESPPPLRIAVTSTPPIDVPVDPECVGGAHRRRRAARRSSATTSARRHRRGVRPTSSTSSSRSGRSARRSIRSTRRS